MANVRARAATRTRFKGSPGQSFGARTAGSCRMRTCWNSAAGVADRGMKRGCPTRAVARQRSASGAARVGAAPCATAGIAVAWTTMKGCRSPFRAGSGRATIWTGNNARAPLTAPAQRSISKVASRPNLSSAWRAATARTAGDGPPRTVLGETVVAGAWTTEAATGTGIGSGATPAGGDRPGMIRWSSCGTEAAVPGCRPSASRRAIATQTIASATSTWRRSMVPPGLQRPWVTAPGSVNVT